MVYAWHLGAHLLGPGALALSLRDEGGTGRLHAGRHVGARRIAFHLLNYDFITTTI